MGYKRRVHVVVILSESQKDMCTANFANLCKKNDDLGKSGIAKLRLLVIKDKNFQDGTSEL